MRQGATKPPFLCFGFHRLQITALYTFVVVYPQTTLDGLKMANLRCFFIACTGNRE